MANTTIDTLQLDIVVNSNTATSNLKKTTNEINNLNNSIKGTKKGGGFLKSLNFGAMIGKLYFIRNITKRLSGNLAKMVQYGIDFTETLNLWQTAMRGNIGEARTFIAEMNKAYGIAEATLMQYQATFKNMLSAMGKISEDTAYGLSEALTKMALDFASLYNVSIESAMTKFQAVLSGQVRPIRSISGYDITENTIFDLYKSLGGTKTMRQLSQTEKRLLRIYAVFQQMGTTGALDDLQKTLANNANQLRIMKEQAIEFATWIGNGISHLLQESGILVKINTLLYTAKELAKSLAYELGYREEDWTNIYENINDVSGAIDELQGKLLGFDKFQTLQDTGTSDISIEDALLKAIKDYQSLLSGAVNPAQQESVELLKRMGYQLKVYAKLGKEAFEGTPEEYAKWLETIEESQRKNVQMVEVWNKENGSLLAKITSIAKSAAGLLGILLLIKKPFLIILTAFEAMMATSKKFRTQVQKILDAIMPIIGELGTILFDLINEVMPILVSVILDILNFVTPILPLVKTVVNLVSNVIKLLAPIINMVSSLLGSLGGVVSFVGLIAQGVVWLASKIIQTGAYILTAIVAPLELAFKIVQTIAEVLRSITTLNFSGLGKTLKGIWSDWNVSKYVSAIPNFANGGSFSSADLFYANENGQTELIASNNSGGGAVMNMEQLQTAITRGMLVAMASNESDQQINLNVNVGNENWFNITRKVAQQNGYDLVKVR